MSDLKISYSRQGERHEIITTNPALGNIVINTEGIAEEERNGTAKHLLASSALFCYASAVATAMEARGVSYQNLRGQAHVKVGNNANSQARVLEIRIEMQVDLAETDKETFEKIQKIMKSGCLVTNSLYDGIEMNYKLNGSLD